jgi:hypothetical protein
MRSGASFCTLPSLRLKPARSEASSRRSSPCFRCCVIHCTAAFARSQDAQRMIKLRKGTHGTPYTALFTLAAHVATQYKRSFTGPPFVHGTGRAQCLALRGSARVPPPAPSDVPALAPGAPPGASSRTQPPAAHKALLHPGAHSARPRGSKPLRMPAPAPTTKRANGSNITTHATLTAARAASCRLILLLRRQCGANEGALPKHPFALTSPRPTRLRSSKTKLTSPRRSRHAGTHTLNRATPPNTPRAHTTHTQHSSSTQRPPKDTQQRRTARCRCLPHLHPQFLYSLEAQQTLSAWAKLLDLSVGLSREPRLHRDSTEKW